MSSLPIKIEDKLSEQDYVFGCHYLRWVFMEAASL